MRIKEKKVGKSYLSKEQKAEIKLRGVAGESPKALAADFGVDVSTIHYHVGRAKAEGATAGRRGRPRNDVNFVDIPLASPQAKVAIVITEAKNITSVLEQLWR